MKQIDFQLRPFWNKYFVYRSEKLLKNKKAGMAELADALDLGDATSVEE